MVRHEEELRVGKRRRERGRVRLRKYVDTVPVEQTIERQVEYAELERVAPNPDDSGRVETLPDGSISVPVLEEELVLTRRTVVRERVILRKRTATERQTVRADVRRERVEVEHDEGAEVRGDVPRD